MYSNFMFSDDLQNDVIELEGIITRLTDLGTTNTDILNMLSDNKWTGEAHDVCYCSTVLLNNFLKDLIPIFSNMKSGITDAYNDANGFEGISEKVASVKKV